MFSFRKVDGLEYVRADGMPSDVVHAFSTRTGGRSSGVYESLNLGFFTRDDPSLVRDNWNLFLGALDLCGAPVAYHKQVHGTGLRKFEPSADDSGLVCLGQGDAIWTDVPGACIVVSTADCVPVLVAAGGDSPFVMGIHAGWRGLAAGVVSRCLAEVAAARLVEPDDVTVAVGPHIGSCCYTVEEGRARLLEERSPGSTQSAGGGVFKVDLSRLVESQCGEFGIPRRRISICDICTCCHEEKFFSYRRARGSDRGLMGNVIAFGAAGSR